MVKRFLVPRTPFSRPRRKLVAADLTVPIASSTPLLESASQIAILPAGNPYSWAVRLAREFGTRIADVQWSGSPAMAPWIRSIQPRSTALPLAPGIRMCILPLSEQPEAFSSPSVTTTWRKECSPYPSQMFFRSSTDFTAASISAVAPLSTR